MAGRDFEALFRTVSARRDNYLSRLFGMFSEDVVRHWARSEQARYEDLGRPTLRTSGNTAYATLDFALRSRTSGRLYVAEQKAELAFEGYRYLRLTDAGQIAHHEKVRAFRWFVDVARDPASHTVQVGANPVQVAGAILVWGATKPEGRSDAMATYGFADVLSIEDMLHDLRDWGDEGWRTEIRELRGWANELFDGVL